MLWDEEGCDILVLVSVDDSNEEVICWCGIGFFDVLGDFDDWIRFLFVVISLVWVISYMNKNKFCIYFDIKYMN